MQNLDTHKIIETQIARGVPKEYVESFVETAIIISKAQFDNLEKDYSNLITKNDLRVSFMEFKEELVKELDLKFATKDDLKIFIISFKEELMKELDLKFATKNDLLATKNDLNNSFTLSLSRLESSMEKNSNKLLMWVTSFFGITFLSIMPIVISFLFNKGV